MQSKRPNKKTLGITFRGVSVYNRETKRGLKTKFRARIKVDHNESRYLGIFELPEDAAAAYNKAAKNFYGTRVAKKLGRWNVLN